MFAQEKHLKQVHLSRLSPVMWAWNKGYPRKTLSVPIKSAYGMGATEGNNYEFATPVNPKGSPIWSETWQQRGAGALKKVHPIAMNGCGCEGMGEWNWDVVFNPVTTTHADPEEAQIVRQYSTEELQRMADEWEAASPSDRPTYPIPILVILAELGARLANARADEQGKKQALYGGLFLGVLGYLLKGKKGAVIGGGIGAFGGYARGRMTGADPSASAFAY